MKARVALLICVVISQVFYFKYVFIKHPHPLPQIQPKTEIHADAPKGFRIMSNGTAWKWEVSLEPGVPNTWVDGGFGDRFSSKQEAIENAWGVKELMDNQAKEKWQAVK